MHFHTDMMKEKRLTGRFRFLCCSMLILVVLLTACAGSGTGTESAAGSAEEGSGSTAAETESDGSAKPLRIGVLEIAESILCKWHYVRGGL